MKIGIIGTGYVGLTTGMALAENDHFSLFIDIDANKVKLINNAEAPFFEKDINKSLVGLKGKYSATTDKSIYNDLNIMFIAVPTPENEDGSTNLEYVNAVLEDIASNRKTTNKFLLVIKSTVPVGSNKIIQELLKEKKLNGEVASNPEFLSQGTALWDSLNPHRIIIGTQSKWAKDILEDIYSNFGAPIINMSLESAELVKYASNSFQALKVSYINEIANISEATGANIQEVSLGMGYDPVIGNKFLRSGIGYGGSCFPKDTKSLSSQAKKAGVETKIVNAIIETNSKQVKKLAKLAIKEKGTIGILGLTFKPETDDTRESPAHYTIKELNENNIIPIVFDPQGMEVYKNMFPKDKVIFAKDINELLSSSTNILLMTEWKEFKALTKKNFDGKKVFDGRGIYNWAYYQIGKGFNK